MIDLGTYSADFFLIYSAFRGLTFSTSFRLKNSFNDADIIRQGNNFDEILAGLAVQPSERTDPNFVEDVSIKNFLFILI